MRSPALNGQHLTILLTFGICSDSTGLCDRISFPKIIRPLSTRSDPTAKATIKSEREPLNWLLNWLHCSSWLELDHQGKVVGHVTVAITTKSPACWCDCPPIHCRVQLLTIRWGYQKECIKWSIPNWLPFVYIEESSNADNVSPYFSEGNQRSY